MMAGYFFHDVNAKLNYDFGDKNKLYISGYFGRDKFYMSERDIDYVQKAGLFWQNGTGTVRWNHLFTHKIFSNLSFIFSDYTMKIYSKQKTIPRYTICIIPQESETIRLNTTLRMS